MSQKNVNQPIRARTFTLNISRNTGVEESDYLRTVHVEFPTGLPGLTGKDWVLWNLGMGPGVEPSHYPVREVAGEESTHQNEPLVEGLSVKGV